MEGSNTVIDNRPSVKVFYDCDHLSEADFVSVLLGIEEEGIPYDVQAEHCSSVLASFSPTPMNLIGLPVTALTESAAPPLASPSSLERMTPSMSR